MAHIESDEHLDLALIAFNNDALQLPNIYHMNNALLWACSLLKMTMDPRYYFNNNMGWYFNTQIYQIEVYLKGQ